MLWYKSFLETRSRFLIGLTLLLFSALGAVLAYPRVVALLPLVPTANATGELGRRIREGAELMRDYRGYIWGQWLRQSMTNLLSFFAVLLGAGGLLSRGSGGTLFTMSLPISRNELLGARAATCLVELAVLSFAPPLLVPMLSPAVGASYGVGDAIAHGVCFFLGATVLFSMTSLLSTVFTDTWRPILIACAFAATVGIIEPFLGAGSRYGMFGTMDGELYFRGGGLPWLGLLASAAVSAAMLFAASRNLARQDF